MGSTWCGRRAFSLYFSTCFAFYIPEKNIFLLIFTFFEKYLLTFLVFVFNISQKYYILNQKYFGPQACMRTKHCNFVRYASNVFLNLINITENLTPFPLPQKNEILLKKLFDWFSFDLKYFKWFYFWFKPTEAVLKKNFKFWSNFLTLIYDFIFFLVLFYLKT